MLQRGEGRTGRFAAGTLWAVDTIRFVGHARGGRCVFCHDGLLGQVSRCDDCRAAWHDECLEGGRCPTLGCSAPAVSPSVGVPARPLPPPAAAPATTIVTPTEPGPPPRRRPDEPRWVRRRDGRVPRLRARFGPYSRLMWSGLVHLALLVACLGGVVALLPASWEGLAEATSEGPWRFLALLLGCGVGLACTGLGARYSARWLLRLPGVIRELGVLLDQTRPTLMDLEVLVLPDARGVQRWCARLTGRPGGPEAGRRYDLAVNLLLTPWWVTMWGRRPARPVLVYGLPPPGPYVIEFEDGALALVHPDEATPGLIEVPRPPPEQRAGGRRRGRKRRGHGR